MHNSEFHDAYEDKVRIQATLFNTEIGEVTMKPPVFVEASSSVRQAVDAMNDHHTGCVLVQRAGKLVGIFTERDVLTRVIFNADEGGLKVEEVMTNNPETLKTTDSLAFALNKMSAGGYRH